MVFIGLHEIKSCRLFLFEKIKNYTFFAVSVTFLEKLCISRYKEPCGGRNHEKKQWNYIP